MDAAQPMLTLRTRGLLLGLLLSVLLYAVTARQEYTAEPDNTLSSLPAPQTVSHAVADAASKTLLAVEKTILTVRQDDTLAALFKRAGVAAGRLALLMNSAEAAEPLRTIYPGETLVFHRQNDDVVRIDYQPDLRRTWVIEPMADRFVGRWEAQAVETQLSQAQVVIERSLYQSALAAKLPESVVLQVAEIFGWDIDFALDIRRGDQLRVIYETVWRAGQRVGEGDVLAARFVNDGRTHEAFRYQRADGFVAYYDGEGRSLQKQFLRSPVDFRRISSGFKNERWHPVLGVRRPHRGVDYAARPGTPVRVTADGKISFIGSKGGYGRTVLVQHGSGRQTLYAHLKSYARGLRVGQAVRQGQVIAAVGQSGIATGPHLHYEFLVNGVHQNPMSVKLPDAAPLAQEEQRVFQQHAGGIKAQLDRVGTHTATDLALNTRE